MNTRGINAEIFIKRLFIIFRDESISPSDYYFVLYLLSLRHQGFLKNGVHYSLSLLDQTIANLPSEAELSNVYVELWWEFRDVIKGVTDQGLANILSEVLNIDDIEVGSGFRSLFSKVLYAIVDVNGLRSGEYIIPKDLNEFIKNQINLNDNAIVYNPFAGMASFSCLTPKDGEFYGQEIVSRTRAIGQLRALAESDDNKSHIPMVTVGDSIKNWNPYGFKYDLIISNPPFMLPLHSINTDLFGNIKNVEQFLFAKGIKSLKPDGKVVAIIPQTVLWEMGSDSIRRYLVDNDLLDTVIDLPSGSMSHTSIRVAIIIINLDKKRPEKVKFVNAGRLLKKSKGRLTANFSKLQDALKDESREDIHRNIDTRFIREKNYSLNCPLYFSPEIDGGTELSFFVEPISTNRKNHQLPVKCVRIKDLSSNIDECVINDSDVNLVNASETLTEIKENCILVALKGSKLKPTIFNYKGESLFIPADILGLRVKVEMDDICDLAKEMSLEYVLEQLKGIRLGAVIPFIRKSDLLSIKLRLPLMSTHSRNVDSLAHPRKSLNIPAESADDSAFSLGEPYETVSAYREVLSDYDREVLNDHDLCNELLRENSLNLDIREGYTMDDLATLYIKKYHVDVDAVGGSLKHTLGRPRQNIVTRAGNLLSFFNNSNQPEVRTTDEAYRSIDFKRQSIRQILEAIIKDVEFMSRILTKGDKGLVLKDYNLSFKTLSEVKDTLNEFLSEERKFELDIIVSVDNPSGVLVKCNLDLLKILVNNILDNADRHGFDNKKSSNRVIIEISVQGEILLLEIRNNGKPFPNGYSKSKFIQLYSTKDRDGKLHYGGYDIYRIASYFGDSAWDLILDESALFPVIYRFHFSLTTN